MKNLITGLLIGLFAALWWTERENTQKRGSGGVGADAASGKSRTLEELSPMYASNRHPHKELHVIPPDDLYAYADGIANELIQPDLSELELKNVRDYIRKIILDSTTYYSSRERIQHPPSKDWLDEIIDEDGRFNRGSRFSQE